MYIRTYVHEHITEIEELVYGSTTKGDVVKRSDCILVYGSTRVVL